MYGGSSLLPKLRHERLRSWVGERCVRGEAVRVSGRGLYASENVGISNEKTGENPVRRKPKVS
jgi:hypothetical protein